VSHSACIATATDSTASQNLLDTDPVERPLHRAPIDRVAIMDKTGRAVSNGNAPRSCSQTQFAVFL
jgi:hypothetical protein